MPAGIKTRDADVQYFMDNHKIKTWPQIAKDIGCSQATIYRIAKAKGIERPKQFRMTVHHARFINLRLRAGMSNRQIHADFIHHYPAAKNMNFAQYSNARHIALASGLIDRAGTSRASHKMTNDRRDRIVRASNMLAGGVCYEPECKNHSDGKYCEEHARLAFQPKSVKRNPNERHPLSYY